MHPVLRAVGPGPSDATSVAAARRGNGDVLLAARTTDGALWLRADLGWHRHESVAPAGPVRLAAHGDGSVSAFTTDDRGRLVMVTVPLGGAVSQESPAAGLRRVFAAATGPDGRPVVAAEAEDGSVLCGPPNALVPVGLHGVDAADLSADEWGELVCVAVEGPADQLAIVETLVGTWDEPRRESAPKGVVDVACAAHRGGLTIAAAARSGVWVRAAGGWTPVWRDPADRVVAVGGWRVGLAAVAGQRVLVCTESAVGEWDDRAVVVKG
jgi:hypothetical protein